MSVNLYRELTADVVTEITRLHEEYEGEELLKLLLAQEKFPIQDSYVAYLKRDASAIKKNPKTAKRLIGILYEMGVDGIIEAMTQPKETNRQIGPLFKNWINRRCLGVNVVSDSTEFLEYNGDCVFSASDTEMKEFAHAHLGYNHNKGLDFIGKFNSKYVIGEAKFLSDFGGHQNAQFADAISTMQTQLSETGKEVVKVAILDGVLYIANNGKLYKSITATFADDNVILSAILLRDFLFSL
jgi:hypothetical protein